MKSSRFKTSYRKSASKLHKAVGEALKEAPFKFHKIYQEYHVNKINPDFKSSREKFDWVVASLHLVIECHGEQHFRPVSFSKEQNAQKNFEEIQKRDLAKKQAVEDMNWTYIVIRYDEIKLVTPDFIWERFSQTQDSQQVKRKSKSKSRLSWYDKDKAREVRQEQYQRKKEWAKKLKESRHE